MNDYLGLIICYIMPFIDWVIAGWAVGRMCQMNWGWPYAAGVLVWAGFHLVFTVVGMIIITRRS